MSNKSARYRTSPQRVLMALAAALPLAAVAYALAPGQLGPVVAAALVAVACPLGALIARPAPVAAKTPAPTDTTMPPREIAPARGKDAAHSYFRSLLRDLAAMQDADALLERYQHFIGMIEGCLSRALGPCDVSLWCPDERRENLVECVLSPTAPAWNGLGGDGSQRRAATLPLKSPVIRAALVQGKPQQDFDAPTGNHDLPCQACIPLYREYGLPLLVVIGRRGSVTPGGMLDFETAADVVTLIWNQLQATNQRQWAAEHNQDSGVLRDDAFLTQAQQMADQIALDDGVFAMVVVTIRGFRSMFAGHSHVWRDLYALVGRVTSETLRSGGKGFLLGKMADDVFALMLPQHDAFLARTTMKAITQAIDAQLPAHEVARKLDMMALEMQWAVTDHQQYRGSVQEMLDKVYHRLFAQASHAQTQSHRVQLRAAQEVS